MRSTRTDDRVDAEHSDPDVSDVHRAALAPVGAGGLAEYLCHHRLHVNALGDAMPVAAVGRRDPVAFLQRGAHTGRYGLFTRVVVGRADWQPGVDEPL